MMKMAMLGVMLVSATILNSCRGDATATVLEKFLTSNFNKDDTENTQEKGSTTGATENELVEFMKRSGLIGAGSTGINQQKLINNLQSYATKQPTIYYVPQQSQLTNYVAPKRQLEVSQNQQLKSSPLSSNAIPINTISKLNNVAALGPEQDSSTNKAAKADRQGFYVQDNLYDGRNHGYSGNLGGYQDNHDSYSKNEYSGGYGGYPAAQYSQEPVHKPSYGPSVAIRLDPLGLLRLLLQGIPKPLLNLNGKVFFGVELGKNGGIVKGVGYAPQAHGGYRTPHGGGTVLTLG